MKNHGFTLIEVLMGLCLLGLISVAILPTINTSLKASNMASEKRQMMYLGEMAIEKIKAFKYEDCSATYILETKVEDIVNCFKTEENCEIVLNSNFEYENYEIKLSKKPKGYNLWEICALVYSIKEEEKNNYVEYKALVISK